MEKAFIIILNYNGGKEIFSCLRSLMVQRFGGVRVEILIVDNGSKDNSVQLIKEQFPRVKIIENKKNLGFAAGMNVGIKYALKHGAEVVLLLNQDTIVSPGFLKPLVDWVETNKKIGIVGPVIKHQQLGKVQYDLGGKINWWLGKATHINKKKVDISQPIERDYVSGCCLLVKRSVFEKVGLLDENFFLYFEDDDFCTRARKVGFSIWVVPSSQIYHKLSTSTGFFSRTVVYYCTKNALLFSRKHLSPLKWPLVLGWILLTSFYYSAKKKEAGVAAFKGIRDFLLGKMGEARNL